MIKSTKTTLKFSNNEKRNDIRRLTSEYRHVVSALVDVLWELDKVPQFLNKDQTGQLDTWLSARMVQCAGKQASGIVRGTKTKQTRRLFVINKLKKENKLHDAQKLQRIYDQNSYIKPNIDQVQLELDSRFITIDLENQTSFDGWLTISSIGDKLNIKIPFKKTKHFNKMLSKGEIKSGIRLSNESVTFMFDLPDVSERIEGSTLGIDIGKTSTLSCSDGTISKVNNHGHDLTTILELLSRKKKGSKSFKRTQSHRTNYINWAVNQLNLTDVKQVNLENIKYLRKGKHTSKDLSHWTYTDIFNKLNDYCVERGVHVQKVNPTYTSQRCHKIQVD